LAVSHPGVQAGWRARSIFRKMTDDGVDAIVAWVRTIPPIE
jgi:hypothetical protein